MVTRAYQQEISRFILCVLGSKYFRAPIFVVIMVLDIPVCPYVRGGTSLFFRRKVGYPSSGVSPKGIPRPQGVYPWKGYTLLQNFRNAPPKIGDTPTKIGDTLRKCQLLPFFWLFVGFQHIHRFTCFLAAPAALISFSLQQSWAQLKTQKRYTN